mgnify:CR=1 FL=1
MIETKPTVSHLPAIARGGAGPLPQNRRSTSRRREAISGLLFILPLFAAVAVLNFYPIIRNTYLSFTETGIFTGETWTGLSQYVRLFQDPEMWQSLLNTLEYAVIGLLGIPVAVIIAGLLNRPGLRFKSLYRVLFFLPVVTMPVAIGMIWSLMFNGDYGIINQALGTIGLPGVMWLSDPVAVIFAVGLVAVWAGHRVAPDHASCRIRGEHAALRDKFHAMLRRAVSASEN